MLCHKETLEKMEIPRRPCAFPPSHLMLCTLKDSKQAGAAGGAALQSQKAPRGQAGLAVGVWGTATALWLCGSK